MKKMSDKLKSKKLKKAKEFSVKYLALCDEYRFKLKDRCSLLDDLWQEEQDVNKSRQTEGEIIERSIERAIHGKGYGMASEDEALMLETLEGRSRRYDVIASVQKDVSEVVDELNSLHEKLMSTRHSLQTFLDELGLVNIEAAIKRYNELQVDCHPDN